MGELKLDEYGFSDYEAISKGQRCELIFGEIVMMASPNDFHQLITGNIFNILKNIMKSKGNPCLVRISPYDIKLKKNYSQNVLQPDVMLFCDKKMIEKKVNNIPSIVFEVASPSTSKNDYGAKKELYEIFGVNEYFIVIPEYKIVEKFKLVNGKYEYIGAFNEDSKMSIDLIDEIIEIKELFEE